MKKILITDFPGLWDGIFWIIIYGKGEELRFSGGYQSTQI